MYQLVSPPFTLRFASMSKEELVDYFEWFLGALPGRIEELAKIVRASPGFSDWSPDDRPDSLDALGRWFASQVETRDRSSIEPSLVRCETSCHFLSVSEARN